MPGYYVENFGCRATQADGAALERQFELQGLARASATSQASVVVLNTCTVTAAADQDARAAIRRVRRQNPDARIIVTGCYAQRAPDEIAALPGVSAVIGNSHKHELARLALDHLSSDHLALGPLSFDHLPLKNSALNHLAGGASSDGTFVPLEALIQFKKEETPRAGELLSPSPSPVFVSVSDIFAHTELLAAPVFEAPGVSGENERTRPNLKVQDGCDNRCSFCVIPYVRGQSRSLGVERIIGEVNTLVAAGYREVVISGINLGRWGRDLAVSSQPSAFSDGEEFPATNDPTTNDPTTNDPTTNDPTTNDQRPNDQRLPSLIRAILADTSLEKLRISSVEPMDWTDELIALVAASPRIAKHAHVPMQSGSDAVLRRMHRKYRPWHYREKIEKIRAAMPSAAIGADVMVGFPGETDAEFEATRRLIENLPFTYLHVFTYSARPGTPAASMAGQVPVPVARERNRVLRELATGKKLEFMRGFVGKNVEAITLNVVGRDEDGEFTEALTDNYLKLHLRGRHEANRWMGARVEGVVDGALLGFDTRPRKNW